MTIRISKVIQHKGTHVATVAPSDAVAEACARLAKHGVGALVVSRDGQQVDGLISERDIVRRLVTHGAATLDAPVSEVMTTEVTTCTMETTTDELAEIMTTGRFRHVPVVEDARLVAIVSIGDVVKARIEDLALETDQLHAYVAGSY
jgi:CBS domain-containing protein